MGSHGIKDRVAIVGMGCTPFGEHWHKGTDDLLIDAAEETFASAGMTKDDVDAYWLGTAMSGMSGMALARPLQLHDKPVTHVENFCATASEAIRNAAYAVASGAYDRAMAIGVEKVKDSGYQGLVGAAKTPTDGTGRTLTAAAMFAMCAPGYGKKYGVDNEQMREVLARIAWKNHYNGARNPRAQFRKEVSMETICNAPLMAGGLGVYDCSGVADGSAAAIIVRAEDALEYTDKPIYIKALSLVAGNCSGNADPAYDYTTFPEIAATGRDAYAQAGVTNPRDQIAMAEVHDCFTPAELLIYEDLQFAERGSAWKEVLAGTFDLKGDMPVNPDGGLKSFGHPVGASGLRMMFEAWLQLRGEAPEERRIDNDRPLALTHNLGGYPGEMVSFVSILGRELGVAGDAPKTMSGAGSALIVLGALVAIGSPIALSIPGTQPEWTSFLFESAVVGLVVELFVATVLLHAGSYSPAAALAFTAVLVGGAAFALRLRGTPRADLSRLKRVEPALIGLGALALVVGAVWIRRAPSYFVFQTGDMGGYVNSANILMRSARFGTQPHGFTLFLRETNLVLGRAKTVAGLPALGAVLLLGVLAFGRELRLHPLALLGVAFLVVVHPVIVWFSLFPVAESLYAPLILALFYFVVRARSLTSHTYALMAGLVAGALLLVRGEAMLLAPIIVVMLYASAAVDDNATVGVQRRFTVVALVTLVAAYAYDVHYVHAYFVTQLHHLLPGFLDRLAARAHLVQASVPLVIAGVVALALVLGGERLVARYLRPRVESRPLRFWWFAYAAVGVVTAGSLLALHTAGLSNTLARWGPVLIVVALIGLVGVVRRPGRYLDAASGLMFLLVIGMYIVLFARRVPHPKVQTYYLYFDRYLYSEVLPAALVLGSIGLHMVVDAGVRFARSSRTQVAVAGRVAIAAVLAVVVIGLVPQIRQTRRATKYRLFGHSYTALQSLDRITRGSGVNAVVYSGSKTRPPQWFYVNTYRAFALPLEQSFDREVFGIPPNGLGRDVVYGPAQARLVLQRHKLDSGYLVVLRRPGGAPLENAPNAQFLGTVKYVCPVLGETVGGAATPWTFAALEFDVYRIS